MRKELSALQQRMKELGIDAYLIPTEDFHGSENVGDHFKGRRFVSGFTGSAGNLIVLQNEAGLWTDGRYFIQAEEQLTGSGITLYKSGEPGVSTMGEYLAVHLTAGMVCAFDGRCIMSEYYDELLLPLEQKGVVMRSDLDLLDEIWTDRPAIARNEVWLLPDGYYGETTFSKLKRVRREMDKQNADYALIASLDDIAWLLNVRGRDIRYTPVVLSYLLISMEEVIWYVQKDVVPYPIEVYLMRNQVILKPYEAVYEELSKLPAGKTILYDTLTTNVRLRNLIPSGVKKLEGENPTWRLKAIKNPVEVENERIAHRKDGLAVTRFMYWLKHLPEDHHETEMSIAAHLLSLRREQEGFLEESFPPIMAAGEHGAIVHYSATKGSDAPVPARGFLLSDTGAHYLEGTTDITRTIAFGYLTEEEKTVYTLVLKAHIDLASATFLEHCSGRTLDILARTPLWAEGYDYKHGTGHGVGYVLNVHEGPVNISVFTKAGSRRDCPFEEGMITSNEPGCYIEHKFGVRLENLMVCKRAMNFGNGNFKNFETLTMVPFDLDAILPELLTAKEKQWLNEYHGMVWKALIPSLASKDEQTWLTYATREI